MSNVNSEIHIIQNRHSNSIKDKLFGKKSGLSFIVLRSRHSLWYCIGQIHKYTPSFRGRPIYLSHLNKFVVLNFQSVIKKWALRCAQSTY